jgi:hypothetical protein
MAVMISREEWDDAYRKLIADGRSRVAPPAFEDVEALSRGDLPQAEAERVREALSCYPDLLKVFTEPFPTDAADVLTEEELASDLAKIRARVRRSPAVSEAPVVTASRRPTTRTLALAAGIILAVGIGGIAIRRLTTEPRMVVTQTLYPEGVRGGGRRGVPAAAAVTLPNDVDYELQLVYESRQQFGEYRVEIRDLSVEPPRSVSSRQHITPRPDSTYPIRLDTRDLDPGLYRLVLFGNGRMEPLAAYTIRIIPR